MSGISALVVHTTAHSAALSVLHTANGPHDPPASCRPITQPDGSPTCLYTNGEWVTVDNSGGFGGDPGGDASGIGGGFAFLFVIVAIAGIALTVWKVSTSRRMARESGMSVGDATAMTLLSDDGFEATYLASNLRGRTAPPDPTPAPTSTTSARLQELKRLLAAEDITQEEYDARRAAIIDAI